MRDEPPKNRPAVSKLLVYILGFAVLGIPLVALLWGTLNDLLQLQASARQVALAAGVFVLFLGLLWFLKRRLHTQGSPR